MTAETAFHISSDSVICAVEILRAVCTLGTDHLLHVLNVTTCTVYSSNVKRFLKRRGGILSLC